MVAFAEDAAWSPKDVSFELSGSLRQLGLYTRSTDRDQFEDDIEDALIEAVEGVGKSASLLADSDRGSEGSAGRVLLRIGGRRQTRPSCPSSQPA